MKYHSWRSVLWSHPENMHKGKLINTNSDVSNPLKKLAVRYLPCILKMKIPIELIDFCTFAQLMYFGRYLIYFTAEYQVLYTSRNGLFLIISKLTNRVLKCQTFYYTQQRDTSYFEDGKRHIDVVLVYKVHAHEEPRKQKWRDTFFTNIMLEMGLETELTLSTNPESGLFFLKIHAPWQELMRHGDLFDIKPTPDNVMEETYRIFWWNKWIPIGIPNIERCSAYLKKIYNAEITSGLKWEKHAYTTADRAIIIWEIMWRTKFGPEPHQIGLLKLLNDDVIISAYPLHDGYVEEWKNRVPTHRQILYREWGNAKATFKYQPLNLVCLYFGCEVGLYFTWLAFYNRMLLFPTVIGILTFIFGIATLHGDNSFVDELCSSEEMICGLCPDENHCSAYKVSDSCSYTKISYITDNYMTIFYTTFMALWATIFNKMWRQKLSILSWYWNLHDSTTDHDMRPQYEIAATKYRYNSLTKRVHLEHNIFRKTWQVALSISLIMILTVVACSIYFGVILLRTTITQALRISHNKLLRWNSSVIAIVITALVNLMFILLLEMVYQKLAIILTNLENPRTRAEYDKSYTIKIYILSFINYYSALVYTAFFKGKFYTHPGDHGRWEHMSGISMQQCDPAGCLSELSIQLAIIMCGKQVFQNILEIFIPKIIHWLKGKVYKFENLPRWEEDYLLRENGQFTLYMEIHEMVLQYGFVTLFVSSFPLAPMFALINNIFEVRIDAHKMLCELRRPFPRRVTSLGAWEDILQAVTYTAVVFNGLIIGFTSDFVPKLLYKMEHGSLTGYVNASLSIFATKHYKSTLKEDTCRYPAYRYPHDHPLAYELTPEYWYILCWQFAFLVIFEHFIFAVTKCVSYLIPDMPQYIKEKVQADKEFLRTLRDRTNENE